MAHALTLREAAEIHANGVLTDAESVEVVAVIAAEYDMTCRHVEERISYLARHAPRKGLA